MQRSSRLSGFYQKSIDERIQILQQWAELTDAEIAALHDALSVVQADKMIENVVGRYSLPLGIGANFVVNGRDVLVPMVVEEPSVIAAVSYAARLARGCGGFITGSTEPVMIAQIQLLDVPDFASAQAAILAEKPLLLKLANTSPSIAQRGGGPVDIEVRHLPQTPSVPMLVVHLLFDTRDAMGANAVNTAAETIAPVLERLSGGRALLRILSNLSDRRRAWAEVLIAASEFSTVDHAGMDVVQGIVHANALAVADPYRAATHNKGIFNGIDAVAVATGNDWRALEAGAHAYAARHGQYQALTDWRIVETAEAQAAPPESIFHRCGGGFPALYGRIELPVAVGTVGGATRTHSVAQIALKILGVSGARELSEIMAAVGLAQNLAALRALVTEGIQAGHMSLHARQIAIAAGAAADQVDWLAARLISEGQIRVEKARELLADLM
ncbi:MAG: hydroxymethylglutaryl-CoA reductase, degradative [Caldilineaceae bacterium]|nr:hydroxymethylglutaryl-CoA reductase, degradative [Caldilineaceae bacterium]MCB0140144.1 hydroxymethylglutaryl-CoA reductase, degradative [Caldilineaceae bacterium]